VLLKPQVLSLVLASALSAGLVAYAARWGVAILLRWDLASGSARQLELERRTVLVSTLVSYALALELANLFLFVRTADGLAPLLTGAMCAAGTLGANGYGYPALVVKLLAFVLAGLWLVLNHADAQGRDFPLVRVKYQALLAMAPLVAADLWLTLAYFSLVKPAVITSCCGSLFGAGGAGLGAELASAPAQGMALALYGVLGGALLLAGLFLRTGRGAWPLAALSAAGLPVGLAAVVSFVSPYLYELPTHHCPFCLLQREYGYLGYPLYLALLAGTVAGAGVGILQPFRGIQTLAVTLPRLQRRLAAVALAGTAGFLALVTWGVLTSNLKT